MKNDQICRRCSSIMHDSNILNEAAHTFKIKGGSRDGEEIVIYTRSQYISIPGLPVKTFKKSKYSKLRVFTKYKYRINRDSMKIKYLGIDRYPEDFKFGG